MDQERDDRRWSRAKCIVGRSLCCEHHPLRMPAFSQLAFSVWTRREEGLGGPLAESYQGWPQPVFSSGSTQLQSNPFSSVKLVAWPT